MQTDKNGHPYCCAECKYSTFVGEPHCKLTMKSFEHNTAKKIASWCHFKEQSKGSFNKVR